MQRNKKNYSLLILIEKYFNTDVTTRHCFSQAGIFTLYIIAILNILVSQKLNKNSINVVIQYWSSKIKH